jgi:hypothetical protein
MTVIRRLAMDTSLWTDDVWVVDCTPVQCGCSRETVKRSDVAGWAQYGYCASRSRYFWGLRSPASSAEVKAVQREPRGASPAGRRSNTPPLRVRDQAGWLR